jgi:hypothetical protein
MLRKYGRIAYCFHDKLSRKAGARNQGSEAAAFPVAAHRAPETVTVLGFVALARNLIFERHGGKTNRLQTKRTAAILGRLCIYRGKSRSIIMSKLSISMVVLATMVEYALLILAI